MKATSSPRSGRKSPIRKKSKSPFSPSRGSWFFLLGIVALFCGVYYFKYYRSLPLVHQDAQKIATILSDIDKECHILTCEQELSPIDFLNIKEFAGSSVGPLRVEFPDRWKGPYLEETITFKGHPFALLANKDGYFVVPGNGTVLHDGLTIGKDIVFTAECDISELIAQYKGLTENKHILCASVTPKFSSCSCPA